MKVVALISGGKDSCHNMVQCVAEGHEIVALANLKPKDKDELDSYMYQTVGHHAIDLYAEAMGLPLYRRVIQGSSKVIGETYQPTAEDEVEDLFFLLKQIKGELDIEAVSVGAILSNYQRVRVENVCVRLGLTCLSYLWRREQDELLREMIACGVSAVIIKVATLGLEPDKHLGKTLEQIYPHMVNINQKYGINICGEGGEYETFTLDCPLFNKRIVIDKTEQIIHSDDAFARVGYLNLRELHLEEKSLDLSTQVRDRLRDLAMLRSEGLLQELDIPNIDQPDVRESGDTSLHVQTVFMGEIKLMRKVSSDGQFWISGIHAYYPSDGSDISQPAQEAMKQFRDAVADCGARMSDVVSVFLYVQDLKHFSAINMVYKENFGVNPPCRVCVQGHLPSNIALQMDCYGWCSDNRESDVIRHTMHVQGLSHWAPANIGPYSQAVKIKNRVYVAGQIPLCPATMKLVEGGIVTQAVLSLRHTARVLSAVSSHLLDAVLVVCYVVDRHYIRSTLGVWETTVKHLQQEEGDESDCSDRRPMVACVVVPELPRQSLVEWQVYSSLCPCRHDYSNTGMCSNGRVGEVSTTVQVTLEYVIHTDAPLSVLGKVCKIQDETSISDVFECIFRAYHRIQESNRIKISDLPLIRMFYSTAVFVHEELNEELNSFLLNFPEGLSVPVALIPVLELDSPKCVVIFCH